MSETLSYPFERGQFVCPSCGALFFAYKPDIDYTDEVATARCPNCPEETEPAYETVHMQNLHKTIGSAKGANVSKAGRDKNRLNGYKNGSAHLRPGAASQIPMAPAKPGTYPECDDCQDLQDCEEQVEAAHGTCRPVYCHRRSEVSLKYASAFMAGDPELLRLVAAGNAAQLQQVLNSSFRDIFKRGTEVVETIILSRDKDGDITSTTQKIYAHPLIKRCIEIMQVMGFTLGDWTLTPKSKEAKEQATGYLAGLAAGTGMSVEQVTKKIEGDVSDFKAALEGAIAMRSGDETLKVFEEEAGKREGDD